jgi:hypothetical protein
MGDEQTNVEAIERLGNSLSIARPTKDTSPALVDYGTAAAQWLAELSASFILLKRHGRGRGHKILVRSILECTFYVSAVCRNPEYVWRVFCHQWNEEGKLLPRDLPELKNIHRENKESVRKRFKLMFGAEPKDDKPMSAHDAARESGMIPVYDKFYRLYCKYAHGALKGIAGEFDPVTDRLDSWLVAVMLAISAENLQDQNFEIDFDVPSIRSALMNRMPVSVD